MAQQQLEQLALLWLPQSQKQYRRVSLKNIVKRKSNDDGKLKDSPFSHGSAPTCIRVNCILPGNFGTPMTAPMKKYEPEVDANLSKGNVFPNTGLDQPHEFATFAVMMLE